MPAKLGSGLALTQLRPPRGGGSPPWNPGDLSGLGITLLVALMRAMGLLWQDLAKTIPATADGDPVYVAVCPFTGLEWTAASESARPILWDWGGGIWTLFYDGVDDVLVASGLTGDFAYCWVGAQVENAEASYFGLLTGASEFVNAYVFIGNNTGASWFPTGSYAEYRIRDGVLSNDWTPNDFALYEAGRDSPTAILDPLQVGSDRGLINRWFTGHVWCSIIVGDVPDEPTVAAARVYLNSSRPS